MSRISAIALKDLQLLWRDRFGMFWILVFPIVYALFFGLIFSGVGGSGAGALPIVLVDLDGSERSQSFAEVIGGNESVRSMQRADGEPWTVESATAAVRRGDVAAYVVIPEGYGDNDFSMFDPSAPAFEVGVDPARTVEQAYLQGVLMETAGVMLQQTIDGVINNPAALLPDIAQTQQDIEADATIPEDQKSLLTDFFGAVQGVLGGVDLSESPLASDDGGGGASFEPLKIEMTEVTPEGVGPPSSFAITFPQAIAWGIIGCATGFAISLVQERTRGTMLRLRMAPQSSFHTLAGKGLACYLACVGVTLLLIAVGRFGLGVTIQSVPTLLVATLMTAFCFTGLMMFISTLGSTEQGVAGAGWAVMMPMAMLGGGMVPLLFMPGWMRAAGSVSPVKWSIVSLEQAIWRGGDAAQLAQPVLALAAFGIAGFGLGLLILNKRGAAVQ